MNLTVRNILAGLGSFPIVISLILGMSMASGINAHFILIPVIVTNIVGTLLNSKDHVFYQLPVGLVAMFALILHDNELNLAEPNLGSLVMLLIPSVLFTVLSFIPTKLNLIPVSAIVTVSLGIGIVLILKQLPSAFGIETFEHLKSLVAINWLQFGLALAIPAFALIGNHYFKNYQILLAAFLSISFLAYFLPVENRHFQLGQLHADQFIIKIWSISSIELKSALTNGITLFVLLLCYFWGDFSAISKYGIAKEINIKKSLRTVGLGNMIGSFFGLVPANISLIESTTIHENKGNNRTTIYTLIVLLSICVFIRIPSFHFPLFPIAGLMIYIAVRLISYSFKLLKGENIIIYIIGILGAIILLFLDYVSGFIFSLICGLIYNAFTNKSTTKNAKTP